MVIQQHYCIYIFSVHSLVVASCEWKNLWIPVDVDYIKEMHQRFIINPENT